MNMTKLLAASCVLSSLILATAAPVEAARFHGLGDLPGGEFFSRAYGVSADGSTVVGAGDSGLGRESFRWTEADGMVGLGDVPGGRSDNLAKAVSADGSVVVGYVGTERANSSFEAFRWTQSEGMVSLGDLGDGYYYSDATDVSADGSVVVGWDCVRVYGHPEAYRWTAAEGMVGLGYLPADRNPGEPYDPWSEANGVSADGSVVVGFVGYSSGGRNEAFRWTPQTGMVGMDEEVPTEDLVIPDRPEPILRIDYHRSEAQAVSADGSVIVGGMQLRIVYPGSTFLDDFPFRWTESEGYVRLGTVPGYSWEYPMDVSADGSVVVGWGRTDWADPFIWDEAHGARTLQDALINEHGLGSQLAGWTLGKERGVLYGPAISDDGTTIVGFGTNPDGNLEAWRAVLSDPDPTMTSVRAGNWNTASTWDDGTLTPGLDSPVVVGGHAVTVATAADALSLSINDPAGEVVVSSNAALTVSGDVEMSGGTLDVRGALTGATVVVDQGGRLNVQGALTGATVAIDDGTLNVQGNLDTASAEVVGGLVDIGAAGTLNVATDLTIKGGSQYVCNLDASANGQITAAGDVLLYPGSTLILRPVDVAQPGSSTRTIIASAGERGIAGAFTFLPPVQDPRVGSAGHLGLGVFNRGVNFVPDPVDPFVIRSVTVDLFTAQGGDADGDGLVGLSDWDTFRNNFGQAGRDWTDGNFDPWNNGTVDLDDWDKFRANFGKNYATAVAEGGAAAVPEPGTLLMILGGLVGLLVYTWQRRRRGNAE